MTKAQTSWALSAAMVIGILIGYFLAELDKEPAEQPARPTYQQHLTECVQNYQSLYDAPKDLARAICINYLDDRQEATR